MIFFPILAPPSDSTEETNSIEAEHPQICLSRVLPYISLKHYAKSLHVQGLHLTPEEPQLYWATSCLSVQLCTCKLSIQQD